ncbi:MAG: glycerol-3-phosphate acyltransferase [Candidatus Delongbacteria bacterium]
MSLLLQAAFLLPAWGLGGLPTGVWLARWRGAPDPTQTGSGSSGATNVGRLLGWRWGLLTLLVDLGKGLAAAGLARGLSDSSGLAAACGLAAVLGHCASPWARFKGGKGVATGAGAALILAPWAALLALLGMVLVLLASRRMAPASLGGGLLYPLLQGVTGEGGAAPTGYALGLALLLLFTHRQNLDRLRRGVEPTLWGAPAGDPRWRSRHEEPER